MDNLSRRDLLAGLAPGALVAQAAALRAQYEPVKVRKLALTDADWAADDHALVAQGSEEALAARGARLLAQPAVQGLDAPLPWLAVAALGGHLLAGLLVPLRAHSGQPAA